MALLETKDLGITFDGLVALEGVNFAAEAEKSQQSSAPTVPERRPSST